MIRPAAFCGVVGYKPSFGLINRAGMKIMSDSLDTIGTLARSLADCALLAEIAAGVPLGDPESRSAPPPPRALPHARLEPGGARNRGADGPRRLTPVPRRRLGPRREAAAGIRQLRDREPRLHLGMLMSGVVVDD